MSSLSGVVDRTTACTVIPLSSPRNTPDIAPNPGASNAPVNMRRSKGYEGLAASKDGKFIYGMLEGPLWDADKKDWESLDGKTVLRILEFSIPDEKWTGRHWKYLLDAGAEAIGDFNMIDATTALVIERDDKEGTADKACPEGKKGTDCFDDIARFKRIVKIEMTDANANGAVRKIGYIDLLKIQDPDKKALKPLNDGVLTFPFFTIENVDVVDDRHIIVGNDNNCSSPPAATPTRPTTTSSSSSTSRACSRRGDGFPHPIILRAARGRASAFLASRARRAGPGLPQPARSGTSPPTLRKRIQGLRWPRKRRPNRMPTGLEMPP